MSSNRQSHSFHKTRGFLIGYALLFLVGALFAISVVEMQKHASFLEALPLPTPTLVPTDTPAPGQLRTRYLTGTYPSSWNFSSDSMLYHSPFPGDEGSALWGCSGDAEWDEIEKAYVNNIYLLFCPTHLSDPETLLETMDATKLSAVKYTAYSASPSARFGMRGVKGTWMHGAGGGYIAEYFEVYVKDNYVLIISTPYGDNKAFEDVLVDFKPNL